MSSFIKFLGTAGARVAVARQVRASGGIWLSLDGTNLLIDPGPGCLVHCFAAKPKLDPTNLAGIAISHKHLDHAGDVNNMIEAMTVGGKQKKGVVLAPKDALSGNDPVVYKYLRRYVDKIEQLKEKGKYKVGNLQIATPVRHDHGVETYGLNIRGKKRTISYITDTKYFKGLSRNYKCDVVIINVLATHPVPFMHLSLEDVKKIVKKLCPKTTILTHFGMWMIEAGPEKIAKKLSRELKAKVIAAKDGLKYGL